MKKNHMKETEIICSLEKAVNWLFRSQILTGREEGWVNDREHGGWKPVPVRPYQVGDFFTERVWGDEWDSDPLRVHRFTSYIWHTSQIILALVRAYRLLGGREILDRARLAGDYLVRMQIKEGPLAGLFYTVPYVQLDDTGSRIVAGDRIILSDMVESFLGLIELAKDTDDSQYLLAAVGCADWILDHAELESGFFGHDIDVRTATASQGKSNVWQCLLIDDACFYQLFLATGNQRYLDVFQRQMAHRLTLTWPDEENIDNSRGTFWQCWPLIIASQALHDDRFLDQAKQDFGRLLQLQSPEGRLPLDRNRDCDGAGTAMACLAWSLLYEITHEFRFIEGAERALEFTLKNQYGSESLLDLQGAYQFCPRVASSGPQGLYSHGREYYFGHRDIAVSFGISAICELFLSRPESRKWLMGY